MEIVSLPIDYDRKKIDGKYRIVSIASQRAKELSYGAKPKVKTKSKKITTQAIEETLENAVEYLTGEQAKKALEEAKKFDYRKFFEQREKETELEKDLKIYLHEKEATGKKALEDLFGERREEGFEE